MRVYGLAARIAQLWRDTRLTPLGWVSIVDRLAGPATPADLGVMTFNLRYAGTGRPNSWARRRPVMSALLRRERPHLVGTQEGLDGQLRQITADLGPRYSRVGAGRLGGTEGEHAAILFDTDRLALREYHDFWLSDTPDLAGSNTWGGAYPRIVTWARMADRVGGGEFYAVNTHLDHVGEYARLRSAVLIRDRIATFDPALPVIVTGDFNAEAVHRCDVYRTLVDEPGYVDAWNAAWRRGTAYGTAHAYRPAVLGGPRIDWILATPGVVVPAAVINTSHRPGQYPSDHFPVQARLRLPAVTPLRG